MTAIQTSGLARRFGDVVAVESLDLHVRDGEAYGFLGPNGAGKSTTINMLLGFTPPSSGSGTVLGYDIEDESLAIRQSIGVLPEDFGMYERLTARKHVQFAIDTKGATDDPDDLLSRVGLSDAADRKAGGFSTGMKQRVALAMALVGEPELLILDEPSSGIDPNGAREMRAIIQEELDRGATVFFSSHIMEQVEAICDRVGIMSGGRLVAEDSIDALKDQFDDESRLILTVDAVPDGIVSRLEPVDGVLDVRVDGTDIVTSVSNSRSKAVVINAVEDAGGVIADITAEDHSLDDLFAAFTTGDGATRGDARASRAEAALEEVDA
ncbi:ABC transporter ATP-binding protein [Natronorubrum texcoconense]|uniref:ABC-2 type transport system ATP-binding protein n=1 Tax=Natronorubrum texcoconense TaxID=1095776 RepID=A0A1G9C239_9EURY|nr:ABC transporter ATP-binding protein [Natronorubrum texcoconense]SDK45736.1 ABC-2 type transport system ATP-binding protein [Natronorubrum texcoconense]